MGTAIPDGERIGVYWQPIGGERFAVLVYGVGVERTFETAEEGIAFLHTLPIDSFLVPTGKTVGFIPELSADRSRTKGDILEEVARAMAEGQGGISLYTHASHEEIHRLFRPKGTLPVP